jgi:hypothetical protein
VGRASFKSERELIRAAVETGAVETG